MILSRYELCLDSTTILQTQEKGVIRVEYSLCSQNELSTNGKVCYPTCLSHSKMALIQGKIRVQCIPSSRFILIGVAVGRFRKIYLLV